MKGLSSSCSKTSNQYPGFPSPRKFVRILFFLPAQTYGGDVALLDVAAGGVGGDIAPGNRGEPEGSGRGSDPERESRQHYDRNLIDGEGCV